MSNVIEIKNLSVVFNTNEGRISVIRDLSLSIGQGEVVAVVGESGCGKSVLCKTIMGLLPSSAVITGGSIEINGKNTLGMTEQKYCKIRGADISMVFQDPMTSLDPTYSIGDQIAEAVCAHNKAISGSALKERVLELMNEVGIDRAKERYDSYSWMLSGGMRQRCVLAMALAKEPELLLADEPTTALDVTVQAEILDLIKKIREKTKMAVLFITHDLGVVARVADRAAIMYAGKIVEEGLCEEVFEDPKHPYTIGLLHSLPAFAKNGRLRSIPGVPPVLKEGFEGDAFATRNPYALKIDYFKEPPFFDVSPTHKAATWLLDERAPKVNYDLLNDDEKGSETKALHTEKILETDDLTHYFRLGKNSYVKAVSHVSFDIYRGEVFALVGESGSGKSTLARCLLGIHSPLGGKAYYDNIDLTAKHHSRKERERLSKELQFISQDSGNALNFKMTVRDIIAEPLEIHRVYKSRAGTDEQIKKILKKVRLDE
ncbi:MAG: ABC transporter ATP-binding protein, partial [Lachnospiraceae bacterium]|nr:ABC transporter ATP-binding protein [Lachnospiraceae bacterium]